MLTPGQPVLALTLKYQAPGQVATGVPVCKSLVWLDLEKVTQGKQSLIPGLPLLRLTSFLWATEVVSICRCLSCFFCQCTKCASTHNCFDFLVSLVKVQKCASTHSNCFDFLVSLVKVQKCASTHNCFDFLHLLEAQWECTRLGHEQVLMIFSDFGITLHLYCEPVSLS